MKDDSENHYIVANITEYEVKDGMMHVWGQNVADEYHSMEELYDHRMALNIALFHAWHECNVVHGNKPQVMKSKLHNDGTMFDGYFIVMAITEIGQISYHYKLEHWNKFQIPEVEQTPEWDGHTSQIVIQRLMAV